MTSTDENTSTNQGLPLINGPVHSISSALESEAQELIESDEIEKEERRKMATKVLEKQG